MGKHYIASEGKGVGKASPAQILEVISGTISITVLRRYKNSNVLKSVIRELSQPRNPGARLASQAWNKEAIPAIRRVGPYWES